MLHKDYQATNVTLHLELDGNKMAQFYPTCDHNFQRILHYLS